MGHPYTADIVERFNKYVDRKSDTKACWPWTGCTYIEGYGRLRISATRCVVTHRISYQVFHNVTLDEGLIVRHDCDNPICQNPHHLQPGTLADNIADCVSRERNARGEKNRNAKITVEIVEAIRREYVPYYVTCSKLGKKYGLSMNQVWLIIKRKQWRHV